MAEEPVMKKEEERSSTQLGLSRAIVLGCAVMLAGVAHAGASGGTPITHCGFAITAPGNYFLANDLRDCLASTSIRTLASVVAARGQFVNSHGLLGGVLTFEEDL